MVVSRYHRHSAQVLRSQQWKAVRLEAKRRDKFACVQCGAIDRLEVDHIKPVRTHPDLAFNLGNLQTLCCSCHSRKTRIEVGHPALNAPRQAWRDLVQNMHPKPQKQDK